ncbi:putative membrane protein [Mucilaginibacter sp. OAE612]
MEPTEDSNNYKYGVFYYNKDDSRIIVPKRIKYMAGQ